MDLDKSFSVQLQSESPWVRLGKDNISFICLAVVWEQIFRVVHIYIILFIFNFKVFL